MSDWIVLNNDGMLKYCGHYEGADIYMVPVLFINGRTIVCPCFNNKNNRLIEQLVKIDLLTQRKTVLLGNGDIKYSIISKLIYYNNHLFVLTRLSSTSTGVSILDEHFNCFTTVPINSNSDFYDVAIANNHLFLLGEKKLSIYEFTN